MSFYEFFDTDHKNRVQILGADIFRVTHFREKKNKDTFIDPPWYKHIVQNLDNQDESDFTIELTGNLTRIIGKHGRICFAEKKIQHDRGGGFILLSKIENESFYGWGEWFNHFERKKGKIHLSSHESPELLQGHLTYSTIPLFISSQNYLFFLLSSYPSDWVIDATEIKIKPGEGQLDYLVICGESPKDLISKYTGLTGRPRLIPRWGFGLWATCYPQENQFKVLQFARTHRERQIPLDVIVLDYHWEERFHNFQWRKKLFPDPEQLITDLKKMDIKLGLIFTPFLNDQNQPVRKTIFNYLLKNIPKGCERDDERTIDAYQEAQSAGYLAHEHAEWWFGKGGMFDFTYPEGTIWWNTRMQKLYDSGIALFKNDDGEYLPKKSRSHIGMSSNEYHNIYGFYFGRAIYEGMEQLDERRGMIYSRSVWAGSQRYPAMFLGDQHPNFKNIQKTMTAGLNLSLAGFAYWGADILGLDGKTTPETHMRYTLGYIFTDCTVFFQARTNRFYTATLAAIRGSGSPF